MLNKISISLITSLCLSSSFVMVNAAENNTNKIAIVKIEPGLEKPVPLSMTYIDQYIGMINPGYNKKENIRTENCLACAKSGYHWLKEQLILPNEAPDDRPTAANIWLNNRTARLLPGTNFEPEFTEQLEDDFYIYSNPEDKGVIIIPDDDYAASHFLTVKLKKNNDKDIKTLENYIIHRFLEPEISKKSFLSGIIYLDYYIKIKGIYNGHFVNFYTIFNENKHETYIIDPQEGKS